MKILVTGANGQIGWELMRLAPPDPIRITALTRDQLDITNNGEISEAIRACQPTIVINCAAYTLVDGAEEDPERAFAVNAVGTGNLARACSDADIPLLHISTDYVFDGTRDEAYTEEDSVAPLGVYGQSKWEGEEVIRGHLENHIILRSSWIFGIHGHNFVKKMLLLGRDRTEVKVVADQFGSPTPASAIAKTLIALAHRIGSGTGVDWGTYHYCGHPQTSWHAFAETIYEYARERHLIDHPVAVQAIKSSEYPRLAKTPAKAVLDCTKWSRTFDIALPSWQSGLKSMLAQMSRQ